MKTLRSIFRLPVLALCAAGLLGPQILPAPSLAAEQPAPVLMAAADCYAVGQQVAAQNGGTLARASQSDQGGQPVCVIVVLVPAKDGKRPRRVEFVVPQN
jgi:putative hemolysin